VGRWGQVEGKCSKNFDLETSAEKLGSLDNIEKILHDWVLEIRK
jgi:hypothetical protein